MDERSSGHGKNVEQSTRRNDDAFKDLYDESSQLKVSCNVQLQSIEMMLSQLESPNDSHELRDSMNAHMEQALKDLDRQKGLLMKLEQMASNQDEETLVARSGADLNAQLSRFRDMQRQSRDKCQSFIAKAQEMLSLEESSKVDEEESPLIAGPVQKHAIEQEISYNEQLIAERDRGIREIEAAMLDVHEIFRDLGLLVNEQQMGIDNIESGLEAAASRTRGATRELDRANERRRAHTWTLYSIIMIILILLVILLILMSI